ncbi:hypothetical protein C8R46DRAFT_1097185 [Mycena filopes]|nr:hypothetical protein C8R46DRAFT_1097185 [Mycena filopes]
MRLTETPLFRGTRWRTQALVDGSWRNLPDDVLGHRFTHFLPALKKLDTDWLPSPLRWHTYDFKDGLNLSPWTQTSYSVGRGKAWMCLLHFQVFDWILAMECPESTTLSTAEPRRMDAFPYSNGVETVFNSLRLWTSRLDPFQAWLSSTSFRPPVLLPPSSAHIQSLPAVLAFAQHDPRRNKEPEHKTKEFKALANLLGMKAAFAWILEFGTLQAPVFAHDPVTNFDSTGTVWTTRYMALHVDQTFEPLLSGVDLLNFLRGLSCAMNSSPVVAFGVLDLSTRFLDLQLEQDMNHALFAAGSASPALACMEQRIYKFLRSDPACPILEAFKAVNASGFTKDMPRCTPSDTARFTDFKERFLTKRQGRPPGRPPTDPTEGEKNLSEQVKTLTETLAQEKLRLGTELEESERRRQNAAFTQFLEAENTSRDLKRKYEEDMETATRHYDELAARHAQANARIAELEGVGSRRDAELTALRAKLAQSESTLNTRLSILAASVKEISDELYSDEST